MQSNCFLQLSFCSVVLPCSSLPGSYILVLRFMKKSIFFIFICLNVNFLQEFAISKNIQLGDEKGLRFPCVWDWSLQFTSRDRLLFHNPLYIGKSGPSVHNGALRSFKRSKVIGGLWGAVPGAAAVLTLRGRAGEAAGALALAVGAFIVLASQPKEIIFCRSSNVNCWALCFRTFSDVSESLPIFALFHLWKSDDRPHFPQGCQYFL